MDCCKCAMLNFPHSNTEPTALKQTHTLSEANTPRGEVTVLTSTHERDRPGPIICPHDTQPKMRSKLKAALFY